MNAPEQVNCYDHPRYWDFAFSDETLFEADFIEAAAKKYSQIPVQNLYEPGCGGGRLVVEMAKRGYEVTACDTSQSALDYLRSRLNGSDQTERIHHADMTNFCPPAPVDLAFNTVNTFRHLLTEDAARTHLQTVAGCLQPGGLYVLGLHLMPPDADEDDSEDWSVQEDDLRVNVFLEVESFSRETRLEQLRFELTVQDGDEHIRLQTTYTMRLYLADQMRSLLESVPDFELCDVYDFCYDIDEPLELNDELGDTVLILRRRSG